MRIFKKVLIWLGISLVALAVLLFIAASVLINQSKPQLEQVLTENIGLETRIDGPISLKIMPGISVVAIDLKVISNETYIVRIENIEIAVDFAKLFSGEIVVNELHLNHPQAYIVRNVAGIFNFEELYAQVNKPAKKAVEKLPVNLEVFTIQGGSILYFDQAHGDTLRMGGIDIYSEDLGFTGTLDNFKVNQIYFNGEMNIRQFKLNDLKLDSLQFGVNGKEGKLKISDKRKTVFDGNVKGHALIDFNSKPVSISLYHKAQNMDCLLFLRAVDSDEYLEGRLSYEISLDFQSFDWQKIMTSSKGQFHIAGNNLTFYGLDLDKTLKEFEVTKEFNVMNLAAVFLAGPYGSVFAKGIDYKDILTGYDGEQTTIDELTGNWKINKGIAIADDVAFKTDKYRMAVDGKLDLVNKQYNNLTIAMVNKDGCVGFSQTLSGDFEEPQTTSMMVIGIAFGKSDNMWKVLSTPSKRKCTPFYTGSITHP